MMKQFYLSGLYQYPTDDCGHTFTTKIGMISLDSNMASVSSLSSSHIVIRGTAAKIRLPVRQILLLGTPTLKCCSQMDFKGTDNGKDLLTNRKDPWAESKGLKGLLQKNQFPRT